MDLNLNKKLKLKKKLRFLRTLEEYISNIPLGIIQIFYTFSAKFILRSKLLNTLGIQLFRIKMADMSIESRRKSKISTTQKPEGGLKDNRVSELLQKGILEIENVLPAEKFTEVKILVQKILTDGVKHKSFVKAGAEYKEVVVKDELPELYQYLNKEFWIADVAKSYLGKNRLKMEWRIKLIRDYDGTFDNNTLWHSDIYFNTLKAFIYLNDVDKSKDVYNYIEESHLMTPSVKKLHYEYSRKLNKQPWPSDREVDELNFKLFHKSIKENTLVISDTRGLHRRHLKSERDDNWRATLFCSFRTSPYRY